MRKFLLCLAWFAVAASAQSTAPCIGVGVKVSTLGVGVEAAVRAAKSVNLRAGVNAFNYSHPFTNDGISYDGRLMLRSVQANLDWFFAGDFHLSPGLLVYNGNKGTGTASVAAGQQFTLGGTTYTSSAALPITGNGTLTLNKTSPMLLLGWGNLIPRTGSHFSVNIEAGAAYQGAAKAALNLAGSICDPSGNNCQNAATYPAVQTNVQGEVGKLNSKLTRLQLYPVISVGLSYSFGG